VHVRDALTAVAGRGARLLGREGLPAARPARENAPVVEERGATRTAAVREERRVVTVLFADLVGSTALAERLDPEDVRLVVGDAVRRIVTEVERYGGHIKDLAGDGVLAFFGAPQASEDDPERAVRAGLQIVEELGRYGHEVDESFGVGGFGVRVGIATGPVVLGLVGGGGRVEYGAFGDTVNVAARLQAHAEAATVLVDAETRRLASTQFEWGEARHLQLKGKSQDVAAFQVRRALAAGARRPSAETRFVGRERELASARELLEGVAGGRGGVLFLVGEAGIGKSRLLGRVQDEFAGTWLEGRCFSYGESLPYWPFRELLREWLGLTLDDAELRARVSLRREVRRLFGERELEIYPYLGSLLGLGLEPDAAARLAQLAPEALRYRTFEVVATLVGTVAENGPVVVALEDLHWADPTSLELAEALLPVAEEAAVLLAVTMRSERDTGAWRLRELAEREFPHLARTIALEPLAGDADRELLAAMPGAASLPSDLQRRARETAEGNPFFLEEIVRALLDASSTAATQHEVEVPQSIEKVILARLDRLTPRDRDVLTAASVLGRRFGLPLLDGVLAGTEGVDAALHELQRSGLIRAGRRWPQPEFAFKHVLIQETAYRTLLGPQRAELHRRAAAWLEERFAESGEDALGLLAHHWLAAEDEPKAAAYLVRAGDASRQKHSLDEAIKHYRLLLPLLERRGAWEQMALVLFKLGLALHMALRFGEANEIYQRGFELWKPPRAPAAVEAALRIASDALPDETDPIRSYAPANMQLQMALYDRLVERWPEATIVPWLAERWEISADGLRYVFRLREGLRWSDGTPLTARDVEEGVKRTLDPADPGVSVAVYYVLEGAQDYARGRGARDAVGVRALDERTLEFRLAAPAPYFLSVVNRPDGGPRSARDAVSGAFALTERSDERLVLERREGALLPRPGNVRRVELVRAPLGDSLARLERGDAQLVVVQAASEAAAELRDVAVEPVLGPPAWTFYLVFDHADPIAGDVAMRRALAHAFDRERIAAILPPSFRVATGGIVPPALHGHTPEIGPRFDPELARRHLADARSFGPLRLAATRDEHVGRLMHTLADSWRELLDLDVELKLIDEPYASVRMRMIEYGSVAPAAWFPGYPDPEYYLRLLLHSEAKDNRGGWSSGEFDTLIEQARRELDGRRRLELFHEADRLAVADQVAVLPLAYAGNAFFVDRRLHGWWEFGKSWSSFADLVLDAG
jgi:ABC-type oligopeptide transport system substrate-binding subunit/class 3 adenylate cyclase